MEYIKTFTNCGCQIRISGELHNAEICYCPKHEAAPDMYEALKELVEWLEDDEKMIGNVVTIQGQCHQALAKAEGKEV